MLVFTFLLIDVLARLHLQNILVHPLFLPIVQEGIELINKFLADVVQFVFFNLGIEGGVLVIFTSWLVY